jgi:hypothetical protein
MPLYTFNLCRPDGVATTFEARELPRVRDVFAVTDELLNQHLSCDYVEVWDGDRPLLERHRFQPVLRPVGPNL